jgi:hypothetical protein
VGLIENENFETITCGGIHSPLAEIPGIVNAVVAGGIDFDNIE